MDTTGRKIKGGARPGSGRKSQGYLRKSVCLTPHQWDYLKQIGCGIEAAGLRAVIDAHAKQTS